MDDGWSSMVVAAARVRARRERSRHGLRVGATPGPGPACAGGPGHEADPPGQPGRGRLRHHGHAVRQAHLRRQGPQGPEGGHQAPRQRSEDLDQGRHRHDAPQRRLAQGRAGARPGLLPGDLPRHADLRPVQGGEATGRLLRLPHRLRRGPRRTRRLQGRAVDVHRPHRTRLAGQPVHVVRGPFRISTAVATGTVGPAERSRSLTA